jgi:hypothetical protein
MWCDLLYAIRAASNPPAVASRSWRILIAQRGTPVAAEATAFPASEVDDRDCYQRGRPTGPRKPKKGNAMTTATNASPADARMSPAIQQPHSSSQHMVRIPPEEIAERAYELFMARGGAHGQDIDDWLLAESELVRARLTRQPKTSDRMSAA